jgi:hypothetical protein
MHYSILTIAINDDTPHDDAYWNVHEIILISLGDIDGCAQNLW